MDDERLALVMLKPDAVRQRLTGPVLRWLAGHGFVPVRFRHLPLTAASRADLYRTTRGGGRLDWELNAVLYTLGPVQAVLLRGPAGGPAAAALSGRLKGDFRPARAVPGTMRADLGALNPIFNLVHAADDGTSVRRETAVLFDGQDAADETELRAAADLPPAPFALWTVVAATVGDWAVRQGAEKRALAKVVWPPDSDGPRRPALQGAARAIEDIAATLPPDAARALSGVRAGHTPWSAWREQTVDGDGVDPWPSYLTYTTLRYLDLCLETPR